VSVIANLNGGRRKTTIVGHDGMIHRKAVSYSIESHVTGQGTKRYYVLADGDEGHWYWAAIRGDRSQLASIGNLHGPFSSKCEAIAVAEGWSKADSTDAPVGAAQQRRKNTPCGKNIATRRPLESGPASAAWC
jgi:hypothetical protein